MPHWHVSLIQELFPVCWLSSAFCYVYISFYYYFCASSQSLLLFRFSYLSLSSCILFLIKKFPQLPIYLNSFPPTLFSCPCRLGIFWKWKVSFYTMGKELQWKRERPNIFSLQSYPWVSDLSHKAVRGNFSWCFRY